MISCCLNRALEIARLPMAQWADRIKAIPDVCQDERCGESAKAIGCRLVNNEYLRMQWLRAEYKAKRA